MNAKPIDLDRLIANGYSEDTGALRRWKLPYRAAFYTLVFSAIVLVICAWVLHFSIFIWLLVPIAVLGISIKALKFALPPKCKVTGRRFEKYENQWTSENIKMRHGRQIIYVNPDTKTYFSEILWDDNSLTDWSISNPE